MGMYYCHGCDHYHDSKSDAGYNETPDHRSYCDDTMPEGEVECNNPVWHDVFGAVPIIPTIKALQDILRPFPTNPATHEAIGKVDCLSVD